MPSSNLQRPLGAKRSRRAPFRAFGLKLALVAALVSLIAFVVSRIDLRHDLHRMRVAVLSGAPEGNYHAVVAKMATLAAERDGSVTNVASAGSVENVQRLLAAAKTCDVQFALVQDGSDWGMQGGRTPLALVGRLVKPESVLFLGKDADAVRDFAELRGMKIGVGPAGSGTERVAAQLFALPELAELGVVRSTHPMDEQLAMLERGDLDLGVFVIEDDAPLVIDAVTKRGLQIAGFAHPEGVARRLPHLRTGRIDAGAYDAVRVLPKVDKKVMRVETLVVGNGCAGRTATMDLLSVLTDEFPEFLRYNKDTPNTTSLPMAPVAQEFFDNGGPQIADLYVPWLVEVMPPANWAYVVMGVSLLFNAMGFGHRYRLWRIDAARVRLEEHLVHVFGTSTTLGDIQRLSPDKHSGERARAEVSELVRDFEALAARSRRYSLSMLVPMGQEMAYRYQEEIIYETIAVLRDFARRADALAEERAGA